MHPDSVWRSLGSGVCGVVAQAPRPWGCGVKHRFVDLPQILAQQDFLVDSGFPLPSIGLVCSGGSGSPSRSRHFLGSDPTRCSLLFGSAARLPGWLLWSMALESQVVLLLPRRFILKLRLCHCLPPAPGFRPLSRWEVDSQFLGRLVFRPPWRHARISAYSASAFRCFDCWSGGGVGRCCHFASFAGFGCWLGVGDLSAAFLDSLRLALLIGSRPHRFAAYFCILLDLWPQS